jgi:hypothetical protein
MNKQARLVTHGALALLTLVVFLPHHSRGLMLYDLGELLLYVRAILDGDTPGIDFVVNGYGPGRYLLIAGLSAVFGAAPLSLAFGVFLALRIAITAALYEVALRLLGPRWTPWALFPVVLSLLVPGPLHKGFFQLGTLALLISAWAVHRTPTSRRAAAMGVVIAACALFRLDLGLFGAVMLGAVSGTKRSPRVFVWGALAPTIGLVALTASLVMMGDGVLTAVGGQVWHDVAVNQTISFPTFPGPVDQIVERSLDRLLLWLPFVIYGGLLLFLFRDESELERRRESWLLLLLGVLACNQIRMKPEFGHLLQAGPLMWVAVAFLAVRLGHQTRAGWVVTSLALFLPLALVSNTVRNHTGSVYTGSFTIPLERDHLLRTAAGTLVVTDYEQDEVEPVLRAIERAPPGPLWVPSNQPLLHALTGREDGTGYVGVLYVAGAPEKEADLIRRLETSKPAVAVFLDDSMEGPERTLRNAAPQVHEYLFETFVEVEKIGAYSIMHRRVAN